MIIFKGRSTIKQYMPMKPVERGFKVWVRTDSETGYVYQFDLYKGKADCSESSPGTGLGSRVVLSLTHSLQKSGTHVTFDNFFSSFELLEELHMMGIFATCSVRSNAGEF